MPNNHKPVYEAAIENVNTRYGVALDFAKIAIYGFDGTTDRYIQIEDALDEIYSSRDSARIRRMRRENYAKIINRQDLPRPNTTSNGILWRTMEVRHPGDKKRSLID